MPGTNEISHMGADRIWGTRRTQETSEKGGGDEKKYPTHWGKKGENGGRSLKKGDVHVGDENISW